MLARLFLLFTIVPLVELAILIWVGGKTEWYVPVILVLGMGALGAWLTRREGLRCWQTIREQSARRELPAASLLDGLLIVVAGALLIAPGVITDAVGFLLLLPPVRRRVRGYVGRRLQARMVLRGLRPRAGGDADDEVIDVEHRAPQ